MTERPKFGTVEFYRAMGDALNSDAAWAEKGKGISKSMVYSYGAPINKFFYLVYEEGKVTEVAELASVDERPADFVISGNGDAWKAVLTKEVKPTTAMAMGKLRVKGKQSFILKNMSAFSYILDVMTRLNPIYD